MKPISSSTPVSLGAYYPDNDGPSPNIEPNNMPYDGVYGRDDPSELTSEQVEEQRLKAKADGLMPFGESEEPRVQASTEPGKTRQQVIDEMAEDKAFRKQHRDEFDCA